jgi:hypothetical protein
MTSLGIFFPTLLRIALPLSLRLRPEDDGIMIHRNTQKNPTIQRHIPEALNLH